MGDLRVELRVEEPGDCPVAAAAADAGYARCVARAPVPDEGYVAEEFAVEGEVDMAGRATEAASYDDHTVYRFRRDRDAACVCETVEAAGFPVSEVRAVEGTLAVAFHAPDFERIRAVVDDVRERFGSVSVHRLTRTDERPAEELVFVDRSRLTARQREVLETAYRMGYFDHPKGANAGEVAAALEISPSTLSEHLAAAQRKLFEDVLAADGE